MLAQGSPKPSLNSPHIVNSEIVTMFLPASVSPVVCQMPQIHQREGELMAERINKPQQSPCLSYGLFKRRTTTQSHDKCLWLGSGRANTRRAVAA